jgi:hypothetical protein
MKLLNGVNPVALTMWEKAATGTSYHAKILGDQLVWGEMIFRHVGFTVDVML